MNTNAAAPVPNETDPRNPVAEPIHSLLTQRWSPYGFASDQQVPAADIRAIFEAARWAPSAFNAQPWRYIVGVRGADDGLWEKIHGLLVEGNQAWTAHAPVLAIGIVQTHFPHNGKPNGTAEHDLGAASAQLTFEATHRGLVVHQMAGIRAADTHAAFNLADDMKVATALAIGYAGQAKGLDASIAARDEKPRERLPVEQLLLAGYEAIASQE